MIQANVVLDGEGLLRSCRVQGHAGAGKKGTDIVCAAVSVLCRTIVQVLSERKGITIRESVPGPGDFQIETEYTPDGRCFLEASGAFLMEGLLSVSREFPGNCKLVIERRN